MSGSLAMLGGALARLATCRTRSRPRLPATSWPFLRMLLAAAVASVALLMLMVEWWYYHRRTA